MTAQRGIQVRLNSWWAKWIDLFDMVFFSMYFVCNLFFQSEGRAVTKIDTCHHNYAFALHVYIDQLLLWNCAATFCMSIQNQILQNKNNNKKRLWFIVSKFLPFFIDTKCSVTVLLPVKFVLLFFLSFFFFFLLQEFFPSNLNLWALKENEWLG